MIVTVAEPDGLIATVTGRVAEPGAGHGPTSTVTEAGIFGQVPTVTFPEVGASRMNPGSAAAVQE